MTIIEALKERISNTGDQSNFDQMLFLLMENIQKDVSESIKRILVTLKEFDLHDASHCEKVIKNIENIIGEERLKELSSYELFFLQLSAYLHDSAMAPAEYELKLGHLTEGTEKFYHKNSVLKHDLKAPLMLSEAIEFIKENTNKLYGDFDEVSKWMFSPDNEDLLIEDLGEQLVEYQNFRNGYKSEISSLKTILEFNELNEDIGARRLHTVLERILEDISFEADEYDGKEFTVSTELVHEKLDEVIEDDDLSKYIL